MNVKESCKEDPLTKNERARSNFVREFVQGFNEPDNISQDYKSKIPKCIVQFWDDPNRLPDDVKECMESWMQLEQSGFDLQVFDENSAREFIKTHLGGV